MRLCNQRMGQKENLGDIDKDSVKHFIANRNKLLSITISREHGCCEESP